NGRAGDRGALRGRRPHRRDGERDLVARAAAIVADDSSPTRDAARPRRRSTYSDADGVMRESVIVSAVRTPTGKFLGALKEFTAPQLGALVVAEAVRRAAIDPAIVDECIMGNVVTAGEGQAPARQAALRGGLPDHVAALTINK